MAAVITKLRQLMEPEVPRVFEALFECTLTMITRNFEDYPEHRLQFFALLHAIVNSCFGCGAPHCCMQGLGPDGVGNRGWNARPEAHMPAPQPRPLALALPRSTLFRMSAPQLKLVIDSIVWAFRHTERNVAETGLSLLGDLLSQFASSDVATPFYQAYYLHLLNETLAVMTGEGGASRLRGLSV
jgi:exportin-1